MIGSFSWLGFLTGVLGLWLAPRYRHGWLIASLASVPWILYAVPNHAWALVAQSVVYGIVDIWNYVKVLNDKTDRRLNTTGETIVN